MAFEVVFAAVKEGKVRSMHLYFPWGNSLEVDFKEEVEVDFLEEVEIGLEEVEIGLEEVEFNFRLELLTGFTVEDGLGGTVDDW